jgi:hypothetical protein
MVLRTLIAALCDEELQPLRECLCQLGKALEPQLPEGTSAQAAIGAAAGYMAAALLSGDAVPSQLLEPQSPADAAAATTILPVQDPSQQHCSSARVASGTVAPRSAGGLASATTSSSSVAPRPPASPYKDAVQSEVTTLPFTSAMKVTGDVNGRKFGVTVDIGCTLSIMDLSWFMRNTHVFFYPGSPVQLLEFEQPAPSLGVMLGGERTTAVYLLRNVPLGLGDGIYWVNFLVMPQSSFEVTLGLEFVDTYVVNLSTKGYNNPNSSPRLVIPTPKAYCRPFVQQAWETGRSHYYNHVPGRFSVVHERFHVAPVDPRTLSA